MAADYTERYPDASDILSSNIYIDDVISEYKTVNKALALPNDLIKLWNSEGFEVRKWASNLPSLLSSLPPEYCLQGTRAFDENSVDSSVIKMLGLYCMPNRDMFSFNVQTIVFYKRNSSLRNSTNLLSFRVFSPRYIV